MYYIRGRLDFDVLPSIKYAEISSSPYNHVSSIRVVVRGLEDDISYNDCFMSCLCCNFGWLYDDIFVCWHISCSRRELQICRSVVLYITHLLCMFGGPIWFIIHVMVYNWFYVGAAVKMLSRESDIIWYVVQKYRWYRKSICSRRRFQWGVQETRRRPLPTII